MSPARGLWSGRRLRVTNALLLAALVVGTLLLRLPSFFEPPWHTDEGIFQAVAERVLSGGHLYADAWESKPPLFLYLYVALLKLFGAGVLPLRIAATVSAIGAELALVAVGSHFFRRRRAFLAAGLLALFLGVPFWEGNLALTEAFTVLPSTLAVAAVLKSGVAKRREASIRWLLAAGLLFGLAFLIRQTSAVVALAVVLWLLLSGAAWLRAAIFIACGALLAIVPAVCAFALFGSLRWFWDANIGFFFHYIPSGQQVPFHYRPLILSPVLVTAAALALLHRRGQKPAWGLPALWLTLTLAAALLTGRPYSHYMLQAFPPLSLLLATMLPGLPSWRPATGQWPALAVAASLALLWFGVVTPAFQGNVLAMRYTKDERYYVNFATWAVGLRSRQAYDDYFDKRVLLTRRLDAALDELGAAHGSLYVWGETPWVYALADAPPATRYTTSFYVLLIPDLDTTLAATLTAADPRFIVVLSDVWPKVYDATGVLPRRYLNATRGLNDVLAKRYEAVESVGRATIFERTLERPSVNQRKPQPVLLAPEPQDEEQPMEGAASAPGTLLEKD